MWGGGRVFAEDGVIFANVPTVCETRGGAEHLVSASELLKPCYAHPQRLKRPQGAESRRGAFFLISYDRHSFYPIPFSCIVISA